MRQLSMLVGTIVAIATTQTALGDTTFSQSDWPGGSFALVAFGANATGGSLINIGAGGHPGSYVELTDTHAAGDVFMWTAVTVDAWVYDPAVSGAIDTIDFSGDVLRGTTIGGDDFGALLKQNGKYYWDFGTIVDSPNWFTSPKIGATATDFRQLSTVNGTFDGTSHPDFSSTAAAMSFGYAFGVDGVGLSAFTETNFYDNINYHIKTVPAPEPCTLLGLGGACLLLRKRSKSRKPR